MIASSFSWPGKLDLKRSNAALASALFLAIAPGTIAGAIPWWITGWRGPPASWPLATIGGLLMAGGAYLLLECFGRFAVQGRGTPAPIAPTERLVVSGPYRRVRNPMYLAVTSLILGQAALLTNVHLLIYGLVVWTGFHIFVLAYEEPALRRRFPQDYADFCAAVPRWIPRLRPWRPD